MNKKRLVEIEGYDGSKITIEIDGNYSKKKWQEGKCWAFWCSNHFYYIHFNRNGRATHAYCPHAWHHLKETLNQYGQKWGHIETGKLVIDAEKKRSQ